MDFSKVYMVLGEFEKSLSSLEAALNDLAREDLSRGGMETIEFSEDESAIDTMKAFTEKLNEIIHAVNELTEKSRT